MAKWDTLKWLITPERFKITIISGLHSIYIYIMIDPFGLVIQ